MEHRSHSILPPLALLACALLLASCYKDEGNYDYTALNEVSVVSPAEGAYFAMGRYDTLRIEPQLAFSRGAIDDRDLAFKWEMYLDNWANTESRAVVLGEEKNLDAVITRPASTDNYALVLTVTERATGAAYRFTYHVSVQPSVLSGLMVLQDDGGKCRLDYLASTNAEPSFAANRHVRGVYALNNDGAALEGSPRGISFSLVTKSSYEPQVKNLYVWTDRQLARISASDFSLEHADNDLFIVAPDRIDVTAIDRSSSSSNTTVMVNDGQAHVLNQQTAMSYGYQFSRQLKPNGSLNAEPMRFAPFVYEPDLFSSQTGYAAILYDEIGRRFVKVGEDYSAEPTLFAFNEQDPDNVASYFDVNDIGMDMVWMGRGTGTFAYAVFADDAGRRHLYRMRFNVENTATDSEGNQTVNPQVFRQAAAKFDFSAAEGGDEAQFFECGRYANTLLYATPRDLYTYDFNARKGILLNDPLPEDEAITAVRIYNADYYTANLANVSGTLLYVATWNGAEGKVYEFPINRTTLRLNNRLDPDGNLRKPYNVFTGFGKVVALCVKPQGRGDTVQ